LGAMIDLPLKESLFHFYWELYYSKKGKKTKIVDTGLTNDATYHFIEMPVMLRSSFVGGKSAAGNYKFHIDIGPTVSYWLGGKGKLYGDGPESNYKIKFGDPPANSSEFDVMYITNPNRVQWGLMIGVGIDYPVVKHQYVYIDLRAGVGSTNLAEFDSEASMPILGFSESMDVRFLEFNISVAYAFEIDWIQTRKGKSTNNGKRRR
jgi:Outer membrane protein beta-barrel domain